METILKLSGDGSHTLFVPSLDEHYHSTCGAIQESLHVYIRAGFNHCDKREVNLLEIGFGTGLNAFLTLLHAEETGKTVHYTTLEKYPLSIEQVRELNYGDLVAPARKEVFMQLHKAPWGEWVEVIPQFRLKKVRQDVIRLEEFHPNTRFDVIYFDAFAPEKQPEMWVSNLFEQIHALSQPGAVLTTYCAKGMVRRMLQVIGYRVERLPGPPGKREMLRATR
ncbi:MAG: tRNA (5-methylaminomethyl-2-thiouridine)(34)-methyltransferase MnmD [Fermentimonas sp.]